MHYRRKHPSGKPQIRKNSSDYVYPLVEKGSIKHSRASVRRAALKFRYRLQEYLTTEY